jgi:RNA polymerase sigma-70 factor, ECF subfamily
VNELGPALASRPGSASPPSDAADLERENDLVLAAQNGNPDALHQIYEAYRGRVYGLVLNLVGDPLQAQDIQQTVFVKVFGGLAGFRFRSRLASWIYRIAHNECKDYQRRLRAPHVPLEAILGSSDEVDPAAISGDRHASLERATILQQALLQIPFKLREVVILRYMQGLSYDEISRVLGCAPGTVASRLNRALTVLEERLRPFRSLL